MQNVDLHAAPRRFQFSLLSLLVVFSFVAVFSVALSTPTVAWSGIALSLTFLSLCSAVAAAIYRSDEKRAFALGFALFGCSYLACLYLGELKFGQFVGQAFTLPTTRLADWSFWQFHSGSMRTVTTPGPPMSGSSGMYPSSSGPGSGSSTWPPGVSPGGPMPGAPGPMTYQVMLYEQVHFVEIVHAAFTLLVGLVGGVVARVLFLTNKSERRAAPS